MANARHGDQTPTDGDGLHVIHNFEPANAAALAALAVVAADIGKVARQVDTGDFYLLRSVGPSVWDKLNEVGAGDVSGPASSVDDRLALFDGVTGKLLKQGSGHGYSGRCTSAGCRQPARDGHRQHRERHARRTERSGN